MAQGGSRAHAWIRHHNRAAVLAVIRRHGQVSRPTIEQETHLAFPTVVQITGALEQDGMVVQTAVGASTGGRPPVLLSLRPEFGHAVGMKLQNEAVSLAVVDFGGRILYRAREPVDTRDPATAIREMADRVSRLYREHGPFPGQRLGLGIAAPGVVDTANGVMRRSPPLGWGEVPVVRQLRRLLHDPVWVDNDVNVLAQDQALFGVGQRYRHFLVVTVGRGIGLGVVIDGSVYRGLHGGAAELGHLPWFRLGPPCTCGRSGCLETGLSDAALVARYAARTGQEGIAIEELRRLAREGEPEATAVYAEAGDELARVIGALVTLYAPEAVILSGEGVQAGPALTDAVATWTRFAMRPQADEVEFLVDEWDDTRWARGAASLVLDHVIFPRSAREAAMA